MSSSAISARTRSSFASSLGQLIRAAGSRVVAPRADARRRRLAVALLPRDDRIAQHADPLDLGLDHVAGLEIEPPPLLLRLEAGDTGHGSGRQDVAGAVAEGGEVAQDL